MRVRGDLQPSGAFSIEAQPHKPGFCLVRFYENASAFTESYEVEGKTIHGWEYDEYQLELLDTGSLQEDVAANYAVLLEQAKMLEVSPEEGADLANRVKDLEDHAAKKEDVSEIWDELAKAYSEGVQNA